ncbi:hypothetical protein COV19_02230 [Candidatus Woesearchaeota archaeon CG10_big_fil_rev_8_21_14_0_10_44_13]|nr:MAG: hypothetical protein COV19_02230 [Candidatus Woesearchaeota archaeon CG10_big_fil_rev_8_21_14_0_10_44_13]
MRKNVKKVINQVLSLLEEAESYEFHKQNLIRSVDTLFREYQEGKYNHAEYNKLLHDILKRRTKKEWIEYYDAYIYSILKQIDPLISQVIYYVYNDDSIRRLSISGREVKVRAEDRRFPAPSIEEDKKHELRKIKQKDEKAKEFVEFEREPILGAQPSPLKEKYTEEISRIRHGREKTAQEKIEIKTPEIKGGKISFLQKALLDIKANIEKREARRKKEYINKELEKARKPSLFSIIMRKAAGLRPEAKPRPVKVRKPSVFVRLADGIRSMLSPRKKLELKEAVKKPVIRPTAQEREHLTISLLSRLKYILGLSGDSQKTEIEIRKPEPLKIKKLPAGISSIRKDEALDKLFSQLDTIKKGGSELKITPKGTAKKSLGMRMDLFFIRLHAALKYKKLVIAGRARGSGKAGAETEEERPAEIMLKLPEAREVKTPVPAAKERKISIFSRISEAASRIKSFLFVPYEKPVPARAEKKKAVPEQKMPSAQAAEKISLAERLRTYVANLFKAEKPSPKPSPGAAAEAARVSREAAEEARPEHVRFRFSWSQIKESYNKMMEREKIFVSKKMEVTPSLQMQALKEKVREISEEEQITPKLLREEVESIQKIISEKKKYKVYQPSFIGSFANATIRKFTFYLIEQYPSFFKTLYDNLRLANIKLLSNTYVNIMLLTTIIISAISSVFFFAFFLFTNNPILMIFPKAIMMAVLCGGVTFMLFYSYPQMQAKNREHSINTNLPFAINHISAVAGSGVPPTKMFKLIMESEEYGEMAVEIEKIVEYVELFGYDLLTAVRSVAFTTPSSAFKEFLEGMVSTIESGGDLNVYLKEKTSEAMLSYELERQKYTETLSTYSDIYTGILIAAPLFFIVALSLVSMLGGTIGGLEVNVVIVGGAYVVIPVLNILFIIILELTQPEV